MHNIIVEIPTNKGANSKIGNTWLPRSCLLCNVIKVHSQYMPKDNTTLLYVSFI